MIPLASFQACRRLCLLFRECFVLGIAAAAEVGEQIEQLVLVQGIDHTGWHHADFAGLFLGDVAFVDGELVARGEGVRHDKDLPIFLDDNAAKDGAAIFFGDLMAVVLVGDDFARIDDVFHEVTHGVAVADAGEIRADTAAIAIEAVAGGAHGAAVHGLSIGKVASFESIGSEFHDFIDRPGFPRAFGGHVVGDGDGLCFTAELFKRCEFLRRHKGSHGVFANVFDEAFKAIATFPSAGTREPREESLSQFRGPACCGIAQSKHVADLLAIGAAACGSSSRIRVAIVSA